MCVRELLPRFIGLVGWSVRCALQATCTVALFLVSSLLVVQAAMAQGATISFGPLVDDVGINPEVNIAVNPNLRSDAVLRITTQADFTAIVSINVIIDNVTVGTLSGSTNCGLENFSVTIPQATLVPLVADGNLNISFVPNNPPAPCIPLTGPFAGLGTASTAYALLGSLSFTSTIDRTIRNFVSRRADQITANDPDLTSRLSAISKPIRQRSIKDTGMKLGGTNGSIAFSASLRDVAAANAAKRGAAAKSGHQTNSRMSLGHGLPGTLVSSRFDVWVEGKLAKTDNDTADSTLGLLYVGADYRINQSLVVGLLGQFDWSDEEDDAVNADIDGRGWMLGPYIAARLHKNLLFDSRIAWGRSDNDFTVGSAAGSFDTDRWLVKGQITGDFQNNGWHLAPHVAVIYFEEEQEATTDSLGNLIGAQSVKLGHVTFGPKISTTLQSGNRVISPFFAVKGIWDFEKDDSVNAASGLAISDSDFRGRLEAGASISGIGGVTVSGEGFYDGIGAKDFDAYGGSLRLTVPLK